MLDMEMNGDAGGRGVPGAEGERDSAAAGSGSVWAPDRELVEKAKRRAFTAAYKLKIVREAGPAPGPARSARCCAVRACTRRF